MAEFNLLDQTVGPTLYLHGIRKLFHVPEGLEPLMDEVTRQVLRHQPENIPEFIADFLDRKVDTRGAEEGRKGSGDRRHSWEWRTWSFEGSSVLNDEELKTFVEQFNVPFEAAEHLATIIQAVYRGFMARKEYKELIKSKQRRKESLWEEWLREGKFFASGSEIEQILLHYGLTLMEANQFATKIQAIFRGHLARKSISLMEEDPELAKQLEELGITKTEATKHAISIQKFYRSHRAKQDLKEKAGKFIEETNAETQSVLELEEQHRKEKEERAKIRSTLRKSTPSLLEQLMEKPRKESPPPALEESEEEEEQEEEEYEGEGAEILTDLDYLTAADLAVPAHHRHSHRHGHKHGLKSTDKGKTSTAGAKASIGGESGVSGEERDSIMAKAKEQYGATGAGEEQESAEEAEE